MSIAEPWNAIRCVHCQANQQPAAIEMFLSFYLVTDYDNVRRHLFQSRFNAIAG